jgi:hypothetical protein
MRDGREINRDDAPQTAVEYLSDCFTSSIHMSTRTQFLLGLTTVRAEVTEEYCYHNGKRYTFTITPDIQLHRPKWNPEKSDNPPLSAAEALAKAKKFIATIEPTDGYAWEFQDLGLVDAYGWAWRARFQLRWQRGGSTGPPQMMHCWILMDGTVLQPTIRSEQQQRNRGAEKTNGGI